MASVVRNAAYHNNSIEFNSGVMLWDVAAMRRTQWAAFVMAQLEDLRRTECDGAYMVKEDAICVVSG
jgi:hypothetical protein